ncbi:MAG: hypothetical protein V6Z81_06525 [Parvularculales bacterium]
MAFTKLHLHINFAGSARLSGVPILKKVEVRTASRVVIKSDLDGTEAVADFDLSNTPSKIGYALARAYTDILYNINVGSDQQLNIFLAGQVAGTPPSPILQEITTFPAYPYLGDGETATPETTTVTPSWLPTPLGYAEKQQNAIDAYNTVWLPKKRAWMSEAVSYADGVPDIVAQVGYYMKAATAFIKARFQDAAIAPDVVEAVIEEMAMGAADIDDVGKFAAAIRQYKVLWPEGPTQALGWVSISGSTVTRVNLAEAVQLGPGSLPSDFNAFDTSWLVVNQVGSVSLSSTSPVVGTAVTATVSDPDGGVSGTTWQWQNKADGGAWTDISDATSSSYTPVSGDVGKTLRATATYTDTVADGNTATSAETGAVANA